MKIYDIVLILIGGIALLLIAVFGVRIGEHYRGARAELGRVKLMQLESGVRQALAGMEHDALITYYVSPRHQMPSSLRRIERDVADILEGMKSASNGKFDYQIVNPESGEAFVRHAAHQRVSPFRVRTVARDSYSEQTVWSSLHIAYGPHRAAVVNGISPEHLPRLQSLIMGQIAQKENPRKPTFGLAAGPNYRQFRFWLEQHGPVVPVDVDQPIPDEIDVLFWFDPGGVSPQLIRRLREFLQDGRSIVIAGSRHEVRPGDHPWEFDFRRTDYDAEALLTAFGLRPLDGLVLDDTSLTIPGEPAPMPARFMIRCIAPNQDFRTMRSMPNGHLYFEAPTPFALDGEALARQGYTPTILATTSDRTSIRDMAYGTVRLDRADLQPGEATLKLPLMVWLRPDKPWQGSVVFSSSSIGLRDEMFVHQNFAHRRFVDALAQTLASDERLVIHRSGIERPDPLPEMSATSRIAWRVVCILLIPGLLGIIALRRGVFRNTTDSPRTTILSAWKSGLAARVIVGLLVVLAGASVVAAVGIRADLTQGRLNELAPETRAIAARSQGEHAATVNLWFSRPEHLPPNMKPMLRALRTSLREFQRAGADLTIIAHFPDDLDAAGRDALESQGVRPVRSTSRDEEMMTVRNIYCTVEMISGDRRELLHFPDRASFENLEFRLAFALWRLQSGRQPHIAFVADLPRLSAAEVYHDFQQRNLMAPTGTDVHAHARMALEQAGFRITHVNPRHPKLPEEPIDLILWMQPRRDILNLLQQSVDQLHQGVPMMIAAQHFVIQARQYRGAVFDVVYWPQPQVTDLHRHYLPDLGVELVHEVLFDHTRATLDIETQVNVGREERVYEAQASTLPFLVRAVGANFDSSPPLMRGIGDQFMPFAAYIRLDEERLASLGLTARPLMTTSRRTWTFDWRGGFLPSELLGDYPGDVDDLSEGTTLHERLPLAVLVEGRFPKPAQPLLDRVTDDRSEVKFSDEAGEPSKLLLIGNSFMFRNDRIFDPDFRADHLLLNAAAYLALDESLTAIASHRRIAPGFDSIEPEERLFWRAVVLSTGPGVLLLFGGLWWVARQRNSWIIRLAKESGSSSRSGEGTVR